MRKLKRAMSARVKSSKSPNEMVAPLRDTPGTSAAACAKPMENARRSVICSSVCVLRPTWSAAQRMSPSVAIVPAMRSGLRRFSSAHLSSSLPTIAAGNAEITSPQKSRRSTGVPRPNKPAEISRIQSLQKIKRTAVSVPQWSATSKDRPGSSHPNSQGSSARCPLEEMGRNSARPCTTP